VRNRPNVSSNELLDEVASADDCAGMMKHAFTISNTHCSLVVRGSANGSQSFYGYRKGVSQAVVVKNRNMSIFK
jgi:hypothetical protein